MTGGEKLQFSGTVCGSKPRICPETCAGRPMLACIFLER